MKLVEIREIAKQHNIKTGKLTKSGLIRAIQRAEGNYACFDSNSSETCGQDNCLWRVDCV